MRCNCPGCVAYRNRKLKEEPKLINHPLFTNNQSTATHWAPSGGRDKIHISDLTWNHLAAIVDQYESEAHGFFCQLTGYNYSEAFKTSPVLQSFLGKHVPAWKQIKVRQNGLSQLDPNLYRQLFVNKTYKKDRIFRGNTSGKTEQISFDIETLIQGKPFVFDIKTFPEKSFAEYSPVPKLIPEKKGQLQQLIQLQIRVIKTKVAVSNAFTELAEWIDKNL